MPTNNLDWICTTNVYEVNLRQYTQEGTFQAFSSSLPRLKDMGIETLWFMPITPISQKNKKGSLGSYYAAADYTSINPEFGTLDDFKELVQKAHQMGFKVIIDWVANHTGWDHVWTTENPSFYKKDENTGDFKTASGMDDIIELDYSNKEMRLAMVDAMQFWIKETDIDGFRCDLAFWVVVDFWIEAKKALEKEKKLFWLGELDPIENPQYMQVFDAAYAWAWMHKTRSFYQDGLPLYELEAILEQYQFVSGMQAWFTSNHDENTWNGTEYEKYGDAALGLAVFSCTWPGVPLIYSGQELPNHKRLEFFDKDVIKWTEQYALHDFYKTLLGLRRSHPALSGDKNEAPVYRLYTSHPQQVLAFKRQKDEHEVIVFLNLSADAFGMVITDHYVWGNYQNVFNEMSYDLSQQKNLFMQPWSYFVFQK